MTAPDRSRAPSSRRRFLLATLAAAVAAAARGTLASPARAEPVTPVPRPRELPLSALDLRAPHDLAG